MHTSTTNPRAAATPTAKAIPGTAALLAAAFCGISIASPGMVSEAVKPAPETAVHDPAAALADMLHAHQPMMLRDARAFVSRWQVLAQQPEVQAAMARSIAEAENIAAPLDGQTADDFLSEPMNDPSYDFSRVNRVLQNAVDTGEIAGCSLALLHRGRPVFVQTYGFRDIDDQEPFTLDTICRIASSTKWVSGASVMSAVDDGLFNSIEDPVGAYVDGFLDMGVQGSSELVSPTIAECFAHTAGMNETDPATTNPFITFEAAARSLAESQNPLSFLPGEICSYDSNSMHVAGYAVEVVSPQNDYVQYLRERLLLPLDMPETDYNIGLLQVPRLASIYLDPGNGSLIELDLPPIPSTNPLIAGGLYSTLPEYVRFMLMVRNGGVAADGTRLLSQEAVDIMLTDQTGDAPIIPPITPAAAGYGVGNWTYTQGQAGIAPSLFNTSPGFFGTLPWLDSVNDVVGVFFVQSIDADLVDLQIRVVAESTRAIRQGSGN